MKFTILKPRLIALFLFASVRVVHAQQLWGSGYMSTVPTCSTAVNGGQNTMNPAGMNNSGMAGVASAGQQRGSQGNPGSQRGGRTSALQQQLTQLEAKQTRNEQLIERYRTRLENYFNPDVSDFLINTHIESALACDRYRTTRLDVCSGENSQATAGGVDCAALIEVPPVLLNKWTSPSGYCGGAGAGRSSTRAGGGRPPPGSGGESGERPSGPPPGGFRGARPDSSAGAGNPSRSRLIGGEVKDSICEDDALRASDVIATPSKIQSCKDSLKKYREQRLAQGDLSDQIEKLRDRIEDASYETASATGAGGPGGANGDDTECAECDQFRRGYGYQQNTGRDWTNTITNVLGGIAQLYMGRQAERSAQEYYAQLGVPSNQSYGYPYYANGIYGITNGISGNSSFSCTPTTLQQTGNTGYSGYYQYNPAQYANQNYPYTYNSVNTNVSPFLNTGSSTTNPYLLTGGYTNSLYANRYNQLGYYNVNQYNNQQQMYVPTTLNTVTGGQ